MEERKSENTSVTGNKRVSFGDAVQEAVGNIAFQYLKKTLAKGRVIFIPSLGVVLTSTGEVKEVSSLTDEELRANPHVYDPSRSDIK